MSDLLIYDPDKVKVIIETTTTHQEVCELVDVQRSEDIGRNIMVWDSEGKNILYKTKEELINEHH